MVNRGLILYNLRKEKELTQRQVADYLGLTPKMVSFYEKNERTPPIDILEKLADLFNVSADYLLGREKPKNKTYDLSVIDKSRESSKVAEATELLDAYNSLTEQDKTIYFHGYYNITIC